MKPSWDDAPEWANYMAMDDNEDWHWYEKKPDWSESEKEWLTFGKYEKAFVKYGNGTMEKRP